MTRVAEIAREHGWHLPKILDSDKNFKPEHRLFCRELRFVVIYALFGDLWAKKVPFWVKNSVSWARSEITDLEFQNHKNVKNVLSAHSKKLGQIYIQWDAKLKF